MTLNTPPRCDTVSLLSRDRYVHDSVAHGKKLFRCKRLREEIGDVVARANERNSYTHVFDGFTNKEMAPFVCLVR